MNESIATAVKILALLGGASVLVWIGIVLVRAAKRGGGGMQALGAGLMMLGFGNFRDPHNNTVAEAQDGRISKGTHSGDPLEPEEKR